MFFPNGDIESMHASLEFRTVYLIDHNPCDPYFAPITWLYC